MIFKIAIIMFISSPLALVVLTAIDFLSGSWDIPDWIDDVLDILQNILAVYIAVAVIFGLFAFDCVVGKYIWGMEIA